MEFAIAMLLLLLFFGAFLNLVKIMIAEKQLSFAAFVSSRTLAIQRSEPLAAQSAAEILPSAMFQTESSASDTAILRLSQYIDTAIDVERIYSNAPGQFMISNDIKVFSEPPLDAETDN